MDRMILRTAAPRFPSSEFLQRTLRQDAAGPGDPRRRVPRTPLIRQDLAEIRLLRQDGSHYTLIRQHPACFGWSGTPGQRNNRRTERREWCTGMSDVLSVAAGIRSARRDAGITQEDLAHLAGTSVRTVRAIETGRGNPSLQAVIAVSNVLGLHLTVQ
jgi:DNA-binding XRE family transcriptional regulator